MIEIAGLVVSGISMVTDLLGAHKDLSSWNQEDLKVDGEWLSLAIKKGIISGQESDYTWSREEKVATRELKGTHQVVVAFNEDKKVKYRIVRGSADNKDILVKRVG